jgi:hypothetical protein
MNKEQFSDVKVLTVREHSKRGQKHYSVEVLFNSLIFNNVRVDLDGSVKTANTVTRKSCGNVFQAAVLFANQNDFKVFRAQVVAGVHAAIAQGAFEVIGEVGNA